MNLNRIKTIQIMRTPKWPSLNPEWNVPRSVSLFCGALLLIAACGIFWWILFSSTVTVATPEEIATRYGILWPPIKPEPVENYTFLATLLCAVPILWAAAYLSLSKRAEGTSQPILFEICFVAICGALCWGYWMDWTSIVPQHPAQPLIAPIRKSLLSFVSCTVLFGLLLLRQEWWSKRRRNRPYLILTATALVLAGLSRLVLMSNFEYLVSYPHYVEFIYPIVQDWLGRGIYLDQKSLYGIYPIFLRPFWMLTGGPTTAAVCFVMAILLLFVHAAFVGFMLRFNREKGLAVVVTLLAIVFTLYFIPFWPGETYFQHFPVRLTFPAIACVFMCLRANSVGRPYVAYAILSFGWFWNFEGGTAAILMFAVFEFVRRFQQSARAVGAFKLVLEQVGLALAGLLLVCLLLSLYYLHRFGSIPNWADQVRTIGIYLEGIWAEPMPMWGAWVFHSGIYFLAMFVGFRAMFDSSLESERERYAALMAITVLGVVWLRYYQGRSLPLQLVFVTMPAIMCLGMLIDIRLSHMTIVGDIVARVLRLAIGAPLFAVLFLYFINNPEPQRAWSVFLGKGPYQLDATVDQIRSDFETVKRAKTDEILVIAPYTHLFQLAIGKPSPIPVIGMCQIWFREDLNLIEATLRNPKTRMAVFDSNDICPLPLDAEPPISQTLKAEFIPLRAAQTCSGTPYRAYVRQGGPPEVLLSADGADLALRKRASQNSTLGLTMPGAAVDGNTNGRYDMGSVTHTLQSKNAWWEVDLGESSALNSVVLWNRTDCCSDRLKNYYIFVSDAPFGPTDTPGTLRDRAGTWSHYESASPCPSRRIKVGDIRGRYVRIQLVDEGFLSLAEVQVFGPIGNSKTN